MKNDLYMKTVLTVIAVSLVIIVLQNANIISNARAVPVTSSSYATVPVNPDGTVSVSVKSMADVMDVNIKQLGGSTVYESLPVLPKGGSFDVNIKEVAGSTVYGAVPIMPKGNVMDINIEQLGGYKIYNKLPVEN